MFSRQFENSRPDGFPVLEIEASEKVPRLFVPLVRTELRGEIAGPLADLRLIQTFRYTRDQCDRVVEAVYRFPLPGDAAVSGVTVRFGDAEIRAELRERGDAERTYEESRAKGLQAALTTRESPDVFTLRVAGIRPDEDVVVETCYVQLARREFAEWSLRVPLTTAPRYVRSDQAESRHAGGQPLLLLRDPGHRFGLDVRIRGGAEVSSPTLVLRQVPHGDDTQVVLAEGEVVPERDLVLRWHASTNGGRAMLAPFIHRAAGSGQVAFLLEVAAAPRPDEGTVGREVIVLVDHSGSMEGAKWEAADWAVARFLDGLGEKDCFNLGLFHNTTRWFAESPRPADHNTVDEAARFLEKYRDSGGTELGVALEQALAMGRSVGELARHVLIITDAQVSDAGRVTRLADAEAAEEDGRRISVLCIDSAPNALLATELADRGGGIARFLTSDPNEVDITTALDEVLADWSAPVAHNVRLEVSRPTVESAGRRTARASRPGWSAIDLGDLSAGRSLWVTGRIDAASGDDLGFRVAADGAKELAYALVKADDETREMPAVRALFGARRVLDLEHLMHAYYDASTLAERLKRMGYRTDSPMTRKGRSVYAENDLKAAQQMVRELVVKEALAAGLASAETAFVAVRTDSQATVEYSVAVANALPHAWSGSFAAGAGMRRMAVSAPTQAIGAVCGAPAAGPAGVVMEAGFSLSASMPVIAAAQAVPLGALDVGSERTGASVPVYTGAPDLRSGEAALFDSRAMAGTLPESGTLARLEVAFPAGAPARIDPGLELRLFVGDPDTPAARIRLADLLRRGVRPLNIAWRASDVIRLTLVDANGVWRARAPQLRISLRM